MINKSKELHASLKLVNHKLHFIGEVENNEPVSIDYISPLGDDSGYTSLELLLMSFSSCLGSAVLTFLRKMNKTITSCEIQSKGIRNEDHPTGFKKIQVDILLKSDDTGYDDVDKVIKLSESKYCPVWAMLKGNVEVEINTSISSCL